MNKINELYNLIKSANNIVFFGGAGVSTASGIPDFRSKDGLYKLKSKYDVPYETILSHTYFKLHTETFFKFYKAFMINKNAKPNIVHTFLTNLEKIKNLTIITQNIDNLHTLAGSKNIIELHGNINRNYCEGCGKLYNLEEVLNINSIIPFCPFCNNIIKPDVVLYEEPLNNLVMTKACIKIQEADLLIIAGTSLAVYPAASFINYFFGDNIAVINKDKLPINKKIKLEINDDLKLVFEDLNKTFNFN